MQRRHKRLRKLQNGSRDDEVVHFLLVRRVNDLFDLETHEALRCHCILLLVLIILLGTAVQGENTLQELGQDQAAALVVLNLLRTLVIQDNIIQEEETFRLLGIHTTTTAARVARLHRESLLQGTMRDQPAQQDTLRTRGMKLRCTNGRCTLGA